MIIYQETIYRTIGENETV